ncbi:hypothetical protein N0V88_004117 [Collariella sp. IMI 366227]|nr:hypothetical protein N0V88_004117 [Collariella sp. IMI 366227]
MRFYDTSWGCIGTKGDLCDAVKRITGIPTSFLLGISELHHASVAQRMSWAAHRITKRKEDMAYCLLGIFGVSMPMIYGEGDRAFRRLQEQIMKDIGDESILAWGLQEGSSSAVIPPNLGAALAPSPLYFANCGHIVIPNPVAHSTFEVQGGALRLTIALYKSPDTVCLGLLKCGTGRDLEMVVAIPLDAVPGGEPNKYIRREGTRPALIENPRHQATDTLIQIQLDAGRQGSSSMAEACWIHIPKSVPNLELIAVYPTSSWHKERALIEIPVVPPNGDTLRIFSRFRDSRSDRDSADFVAVIEVGPSVQPQCFLMVASWNTTLEEIACQPEAWAGKIVGRTSAQTNMMTLGMTLETLPTSSSHRRFALKPVVLQEAPDTTINATAALQLLKASALLRTLRGIGHGQKSTLNKIIGEIRKKRVTHAQNQARLSEVRARIEALSAKEKILAEEVEVGLVTLDGLRKRHKHISRAVVNNNSATSSVGRFIDAYNGKLSPATGEEDLSWLASQILPMAVAEQHDTLVQLLLGKAASLNVHSPLRSTALHRAILRNEQELVLQLLESEVDVSPADLGGATPLQIARDLGYEDIASLPMKHGARLEPETQAGIWSLPQAHQTDRFEVDMPSPVTDIPSLETKPASTPHRPRTTPGKTRAPPAQRRIYDTSDSEDGDSGMSTRATVTPFEYLTRPPPPREGDGT